MVKSKYLLKFLPHFSLFFQPLLKKFENGFFFKQENKKNFKIIYLSFNFFWVTV